MNSRVKHGETRMSGCSVSLVHTQENINISNKAHVF